MEKTSRESDDPYYDLIDDFDLIISSFQSQYGLRLSKEINTMTWGEFRDLLTGISPDTALGRIVAIRSEERKEVLEQFTKDQHRIRNEWKTGRAKTIAKKMTPEQMNQVLEGFKQAFINWSGTEKR